MHIYEVLRRPVVTEKSSRLQETGKYAFQIDRRATKRQVKEAVELIFKVKVTAVNIVNTPGKTKRMGRRLVASPIWKKAVVSLESGQKIQLFEGV